MKTSSRASGPHARHHGTVLLTACCQEGRARRARRGGSRPRPPHGRRAARRLAALRQARREIDGRVIAFGEQLSGDAMRDTEVQIQRESCVQVERVRSVPLHRIAHLSITAGR
jgi:hypothetical protein